MRAKITEADVYASLVKLGVDPDAELDRGTRALAESMARDWIRTLSEQARAELLAETDPAGVKLRRMIREEWLIR